MEDQNTENKVPEGGQQPPQNTEPAPAPEQAQPQQSAAAPTGQPQEAQPQQGLPVPEILKTAQNQPPVSGEEKIWGLISYIPLMALMALVLKPSSEFIKLHGRQGLLIFFIFFFSIFVYLVPYIGPLIGALIHLLALVVAVFSMYQAFIGNWWKIPVLGDISELIPVDMFAKVTREAVMGAKVSEEIEQKSKEEEIAKAEQEKPQEQTAPAPEAPKTEAEQPAQAAGPAPAQEPPKAETQENVQQQLPISEGDNSKK